MEFVNATYEDKEELMKLYRSAIGEDGSTWTMDYPNEEICDKDLLRGDLFCLKNEDGLIIGAISIDDDKMVEALDCWSKNLSPSRELARVIVRKEYRNNGIARTLLLSVMEELKKRGNRGVHFLVSKTNYKAINSYAALEFENKGECDLYDGDWWCYEKAL